MLVGLLLIASLPPQISDAPFANVLCRTKFQVQKTCQAKLSTVDKLATICIYTIPQIAVNATRSVIIFTVAFYVIGFLSDNL